MKRERINLEDYASRVDAYEASEDIPTNVVASGTLGDVINTRFSRRAVLKGMTAVAAMTAMAAPIAALTGRAARAAILTRGFDFTEIEHGADETHHVAPGYRAEVLLRWGDPVMPGAPAFDPRRQTAAAQSMQFGYNNDFIGYVPLPLGSNNPGRALLCVNHEYTDEELMFPGLGRQDTSGFAGMTAELVDIEMAAHGGTVIEIEMAGGTWRTLPASRFNRRITAATPMALAGPAAGHGRMQTTADRAGIRVLGTVNDCAGGITPWGTYLMAEENFHGYFWGRVGDDHPEAANYKRYGVAGNWYAWGRFHDRFDVNKEPNEANRFGWVVEVDVLDPASTPVKRTALGRFKHEGAQTIVNRDGRVVVYQGDDERFEYLYRFVSHGRFDPANRDANRDLLDSGTLAVARFEADGTLTWMPLVFGLGPLVPVNGFHSQADVVIEVRRAADLLGATPMDRPEDVEPNPVTHRVYLMLTNNSKRKAGGENAANPRAGNTFGHVIEMTPPDGDHAAAACAWDILVLCGDPANPRHGARWGAKTSRNGWFASPDNCAIDNQGRLWVSTDQGDNWPKSGTADGVWAVVTDGPDLGTGRMFFRVPVGAEMCGPMFAPDDRTLFLAVQHPATDGVKDYKPFGRDSTFEDPATRWPDFAPGMPPRPAVLAITKDDGGVIGS